ncbi:MAG: UxaA family hydrolase [Syntrophales bacterium]
MATKKAIVMEGIDNVATVVEPIEAPGEIIVETEGGRTVVHITDNIPFGHKFAIRDIPEGSLILKYGEPIGVARIDIRAGEHVHVHNLESKRGRGDQ